MNKSNFAKIKKFIQVKNLPVLFERYEAFVIIGGTVIVFLVAGFIFYNSAYKTVSTPPKRDLKVPQINQSLFDKTLRELSEKKHPVPNEPIFDPFR